MQDQPQKGRYVRRGLDTLKYGLVPSRAMTGHVSADRVSKVAGGIDLLTAQELVHVEFCSDCLDAIAELIRERITQEGKERSS